MSKFIFTGDWHFSSIGIKSRTDDYATTCLTKLSFLIDTAVRNQAYDIICPGDVFHANNISTKFFTDLFSMLDGAKAKGITFHFNVGNHDESGALFSSWKERQLAVLAAHPAVKVQEGCVNISGVPFHFYGANNDIDTSLASVLVTHHFIIDSYDDNLVFYPSQAKKLLPNLRLLLAGHDHAEYPLSAYQDVSIVRPGSLLRTSSAESNNRTPCVYLWDSDLGFGSESLTRIEVEPTLSYKDIFTLETKVAIKASDKAIDNFIWKIQSSVCVGNLSSVFKAQLELIDNLQDREMIKQDLIQNGFDL